MVSADWIPIIQTAAGTIIGVMIVASLLGGIRIWWNARDKDDRQIGTWLAVIGLISAVAVLGLALTYKT